MFIMPENIYWLLAGPSIVTFLISALCFTRISMKHIEKKMREEGIHEPLWDKGLGSDSNSSSKTRQSNYH